MYSFFFSRRSLALLAVGSGLLGLLLFAAGMLLGLGLRLPGSEARGAEAANGAVPEVPIPSRPVLPAASAPQIPVSPSPAPPAAPMPQSLVPPAPALPAAPMPRRPVPPAPAAASRSAAAAPPSRDTAAEEQTPGEGDEAEVEALPGARAAASAPSPEPGSEKPKPEDQESQGTVTAPETDGAGRFSVQVAAFAVEANAQRMLGQLAAKGYLAFIVELKSTRSSRLQAIRFGHYDSHLAAARAASEFRRKEGLAAEVEPR